MGGVLFFVACERRGVIFFQWVFEGIYLLVTLEEYFF